MIHLIHPDGLNALCLTGDARRSQTSDENKVDCLFCVAYITARKYGITIVSRDLVTQKCYSLKCDNKYEFIVRLDSNKCELFNEHGQLLTSDEAL